VERLLTGYPESVETKSPNLPAASPLATSQSFEELAAQQGVAPVKDFTELLGEPHAGDESVEEFSKLLRAWRSEGTTAGSSQ